MKNKLQSSRSHAEGSPSLPNANFRCQMNPRCTFPPLGCTQRKLCLLSLQGYLSSKPQIRPEGSISNHLSSKAFYISERCLHWWTNEVFNTEYIKNPLDSRNYNHQSRPWVIVLLYLSSVFLIRSLRFPIASFKWVMWLDPHCSHHNIRFLKFETQI